MPASPFPPYPLDEALLIAQTIAKENAGQPMRRLTIFNILKRSPTSGTSRQLVTASSGYGLTQGSYNAEFLSLTERGQAVVSRNDPKAKIDAVLGVNIFKAFFENYHNSTVPSNSAAIDFLKAHGIVEGNTQNCLDILLKNGEYVCLIQEISGVKRIVSADYALEKLVKSSEGTAIPSDEVREPNPPKNEVMGKVIPNVIYPEISYSQVPSIHLDIQIHISPEAKPEQIEQVFSSMAKHLFGRTKEENA